MEKNLLSNIIKLKLELLEVITDSLPEPAREHAERNCRDIVEVIHQVTGEYLKAEKDGGAQRKSLKNVKIQ